MGQIMNTHVDQHGDDIALYIQKARKAQKQIENFSQEQIDELVTAVCWWVVRQDRAEALAKLAVDEGGFGNYADKVSKIRNRCMGTLADMQGVKTVGIVEEFPEKGLVKIAKPVGVVAALIPTTGPDATPPLKALLALKGRNAIIMAAHPRTQKTTELAVQYMREACGQVGVSPDLVQVIAAPSLAKTQQLMKQADLIVATGGAGMVKAAYSSGTPAYGVGVGNSVHVVDETGDIDDAAKMIAAAKKFDYATSCLADNAVVAHESVYGSLIDRLQKEGGYVCGEDEKAQLKQLMWPDPNNHIPSLDVIAKPASHIANLAGISAPEECGFLIVEETGVGERYPFSGEKLSSVLTLYKYEGEIDNAIDKVNAITDYQGQGHTCGIHTSNDENALSLAMRSKTGRVLINQNLNEGAGSLRNGLPYTLSLSCGTWGGNITTENVNARHMVNLTWVSRPLKPRTLDENELFSAHWEKYQR
jgi:sulfoacetaldehyde dehydrogenase